MVKEKRHRKEKTLAKYDPFVNMLRAKHVQNLAKRKFPVPASQQYYVDENIFQFVSTFGLVYGKAGGFGDLVKEYVWKWSTLDTPQLEALHERWLLKGFTEELWNSFIIFMDNKIIEIAQLFQYCHFPKTYLLTRISLDNMIFPVLKTDTYIDDLITLTIEKILAYPTENDKLTLKSDASGSSKLEIDVCCNNVVPTIAAFLTNPVADWAIHEAAPIFDKPFVQLSEENLAAILYNPILESSFHDIPLQHFISEVTWFMRNITPLFDYGIAHNNSSSNRSPTLGIQISNQNVNNIQPTLHISVVKTP